MSYFSIPSKVYEWTDTDAHGKNYTSSCTIYFPVADHFTPGGNQLPPIKDPLAVPQILPPVLQYAMMSNTIENFGLISNIDPRTGARSENCRYTRGYTEVRPKPRSDQNRGSTKTEVRPF